MFSQPGGLWARLPDADLGTVTFRRRGAGNRETIGNNFVEGLILRVAMVIGKGRSCVRSRYIILPLHVALVLIRLQMDRDPQVSGLLRNCLLATKV
jgi:hypothetical protein